MNPQERRLELDRQVAEEIMGLEVWCDEEECSGYTPGASWKGGNDYYCIDVWYAAPPDTPDEAIEENFPAYLLKSYSRSIEDALEMQARLCALEAERPGIVQAYWRALARLAGQQEDTAESHENSMKAFQSATALQRCQAALEAVQAVPPPS